jgi:hypothetical protein
LFLREAQNKFSLLSQKAFRNFKILNTNKRASPNFKTE